MFLPKKELIGKTFQDLLNYILVSFQTEDRLWIIYTLNCEWSQRSSQMYSNEFKLYVFQTYSGINYLLFLVVCSEASARSSSTEDKSVTFILSELTSAKLSMQKWNSEEPRA